MTSSLFIGLMSGTSLDAVDCALVDLAHDKVCLVDFYVQEMPAGLRQQILELCSDAPSQIQLLGRTDVELGRLFAACVHRILKRNKLLPSDVAAIGSHGQTIWHQPPSRSRQNREAINFSLQIADPNTICELTGITTVADFRRKDMAAGGQGAPLVPAFHRAVFTSTSADRIIVNIGGISNITIIPRQSRAVMPAFDTGPGNVLLDSWISSCLGLNYDDGGLWGASGKIIPELLQLLLAEPYFSLPAPKSTGRELFNLRWLENKLADLAQDLAPEDIQATLLELTTTSISDAILELLPGGELIVCGGGARNKSIMQGLQHKLSGFSVMSSEAAGLPADSVEAVAFAWLAEKTLQRKAVDLSDITGSAHANILGGVYYSSQD
ncbi:MAG: anhydro-N-acetylmuramic acid kinase [Pseudohongiellaceae bacterium]